MILEIIAALVVGGFALALVVEPMLRTIRRGPLPLDLPDPDETPRGIAVAALREIEFDRATGKLSDADYAQLRQQYTQAAVEAMRKEETEPAAAAPAPAAPGAGTPDAVEAIISAKVRALRARQSGGEDTPSCPSCGPRPEGDAIFCSSCGKRLPTGSACGACGSPLLAQASYCDNCGSKQARSA
jgi:hypothetical protein